MNSRVFILGIDGGSFNVLDQYKDNMPFLSDLRKRSFESVLISSFPPVTAPAWSSILTGLGPSNHGIFGFRKFNPFIDARSTLNTFSDVEGLRLWDYVSYAKKKINISNVPFTYPPEELNGVMVIDLAGWGWDRFFAFPQSLKKKLESSFREKFAEGENQKISVSKTFLRHLIQNLKSQTVFERHLMVSYEWDVYFTVLSQMDSFCHFFYRFLDPKHPLYDPHAARKYLPDINRFFRVLDESLEEIIAGISTDVSLFLVSDHGFRPVWNGFYINNFLLKTGLLSKSGQSSKKQTITYGTMINILSRLDFLNLKSKLGLKSKTLLKQGLKKRFDVEVNLEESRFYLPTSSEMGIYRNHNIEDDRSDILIEELLALTHEGKKVIRSARRREEIYGGRHMPLAPDILIEAGEGFALLSNITAPEYVQRLHTKSLSGEHRTEGIFIANGDNINHQPALNQSIFVWDILPTVMLALGLQAPAKIDGRPLAEIFKQVPSCLKEKKDYTSLIEKKTKEKPVMSEEEQKIVEDRLRSLGYF